MEEPRYFRVRNWEKYQHYGLKRSSPWIKLYNSIWTDFRFYKLSNTSKLAVIASMSIAPCYQNRIIFDSEWFSEITKIEGPIDWYEVFDSLILEPIDWSYKTLPRNASTDKIRGDEIREEKKPSRKPSVVRQADEACDLFAAEFIEHRKVPYQTKTGDYVQLSNLRKAYGLNGRGCPPHWQEALHNYFDSPLPAYTLADFCVRFDLFVAGKVDRFGRPDTQLDFRQQVEEAKKNLLGA